MNRSFLTKVLALALVALFLLSCKTATKQAGITTDSKETGKVLLYIKDMPVFDGDKSGEAFEKYIFSHIIYPKEAQKKGIVGCVEVSFIVDEDGSVVNAKVSSKVHPILDAEALRVIESSPKWSPGLIDGKPVRVLIPFSIDFGQPYKLEVKEYVDLLKSKHIKGSKYKYGLTNGSGWTSLPAFTIEDIDELLKYRNDTTLITNIPRNSFSSQYLPNQKHELRMIVLWTIESIRKNAIADGPKHQLNILFGYGRFPSLNPWVSFKDSPKSDENINQTVSDAYFKWWTQNKDKDPEETLRINPLQETNYKW